MAERELLEAFDGALECVDVAKRSSYKALFLVCLVSHGKWYPYRPPWFLGCLFISKAKKITEHQVYINNKVKKG